MINSIKYILYPIVFSAFNLAHAGSFDDFFRAVRSDNASGVTSLLNQGFDPNTRDEKGQTGLMLALREPSPRVIQVLLASPKTNVELRNANDESPLMLAALKGDKETVDRLIARDADINKPGWAPLHYAATNGHVTIMKELLEKHAFIDAESPNGTTPLMMAAMYGTTDAVRLLLDEGADVQMKNQQNMTAVDFAKRANRPDAIKLIEARAAANAANRAASRASSPASGAPAPAGGASSPATGTSVPAPVTTAPANVAPSPAGDAPASAGGMSESPATAKPRAAPPPLGVSTPGKW
ncbi:MAG: ankyrin repeat domain-containing protein [Gammaproteobacteria bacterium]|nr:ankyrin repeat domain-containing protein [Gammaproteobacteria bacterium]MBU1442117.1 ankyrin repeat domain-containing protein [Gammaproteobacteria bacterium]MBU2288505.1 ankyrin repeat domain-containing protein [Gammaproteobacteria bacterium]MBU2411118.1 ankyrin repeat domain-containing protein [Gammaproteobacteria bacterium]